MNYLKWLRVAVAAVVFVAFSALFLDFTEKIPTSWHWLGHLQFIPAFLGLEIAFLGLWIVLTFLFGRVYCSTVCPLGILQDVISRIGRLTLGKKGRPRFRPEMPKTRYAFLAVLVLGLIGVPALVTLLDPYSNYGRIMTAMQSILIAGNNVIAKSTMGTGGASAFYNVQNHPSLIGVAVAVVAFLIVGVLSFFFGRRYCNTICPVGTLLGRGARLSLFKIRLKSDCISCGLCEKTCKGECIDSRNKAVDASRCVACFNCLSACRRGSLVYSPSKERSTPKEAASPSVVATVGSTDGAKRRFLFVSLASFSAIVLPFSGGLRRLFAAEGNGAASGTATAAPATPPAIPPTTAPLSGVSRVSYKMTRPILPPGAQSMEHFKRHCTACHLCVSKCPSNIIRPSTTELGLSGFLQPIVKFEHGFCEYNCKICTEVCPPRALLHVDTVEEKHRIQIGRVIFLKDNCIVETQGTHCGACAEHCPTGAVTMVPFGDPEKGLTIPETDPDLCVGCGACEHICPVNPYRAIYVDGVAVQEEAKPAYDPNEKQQEVKIDDFGF